MGWLSTLICVLLALCQVSSSRFLNGACPGPDAPLSSFCGFNGTCVMGPFEYGKSTHWCSCEDGYGGDYCEKKCDLNCGNEQKCVFNIALTPTCVCKDCDKFGQRINNGCSNGEDCSKKGWCYPDSCLNGGKCIGERNEAECVCPTGLTGKRCEIDIDECEMENRCTNGKCVNTFGSYQCHCNPGFLPPNCLVVEILNHPVPDRASCLKFPTKAGCEQVAPCMVHTSDGAVVEKDGICQNFGYCVHFGNNQTRCECPAGFGGELCEKDINECDMNLCQNRGTCSNTNGGFQCFCSRGFEGEFCEINTDDCVENKCAKGSKCIDGIARYECECDKGQMGPYCDKIDSCVVNPGLCGHGTCWSEPETGGFECICNKGYKGELCNIDIDECEELQTQSNICHGGTCVNLPGSYKCECYRGYNGTQCEVAVDTCETENVKCENGGLCFIGKDREPSCSCLQGFVGKRCEMACNPGFGGSHCDLDLSVPVCGRGIAKCANGGKCIGGFCSCSVDYTGNHCETPRLKAAAYAAEDSCQRDPCLNNATCVNVIQKIGYVCFCPENYEGYVCERKKDFCSTRPCFNGGSCVAGRDGSNFTCNCPEGYTGQRCEKLETFTCSKKRCMNGGVCLENGNSSRCECSYGFAGPKCEQKIDIKSYDNQDKLLRDMCDKRNCSTRANDGNCDLDCNFAPCDFDGGDCSGKQRPFSKCRYGNMCARLFADGVCNQACNNEECLYDGMDCLPKVPRCPTVIREHCASRFANGICDFECNSDACGFDGGDCDSIMNSTDLMVLSDIRVTMLISPEKFQKDGGKILMELSSSLRSVIRIQRDEEGPLVFEWNGNEENKREGARVAMNMKELESKNLLSTSVVRRTRSSDEIVRQSGIDAKKRGVVVWLEVEVSDQKMATTPCSFTSDKASCLFSSSQSVVDYLSANTARKGDSAFGVPIYEAMVAKPNRGSSGEWNSGHVVIAAVIGFAIFGSIIGVIVMNGDHERSRKRKIISAPVWMPPTEQESEKTRKSNMTSSQSSLLGSANSAYFDPKRKRLDNAGYNMLTGPYSMYQQGGQLPHFSADFGGYGMTESNQNNMGNMNGMLDVNGVPLSNSNDALPLHLEAAGSGFIMSPINADTVIIRDATHGRQVLHWLAANNTGKNEDLICDEVRRCLDVGADVNSRDSDDNTPLLLSVRAKRIRLSVIFLRVGADPTIFNKSERSALHEAAVNLDYRMIEILLTDKRMALEIDELDRNGRTALMEVARLDKDVQIMKLLISKGAKIEADGAARKDSEVYKGRTALHYAAMVDNVRMVEFLIGHNANKDKQDEAGQTPLMMAAREGHLQTVKILCQQGASIDTTDLMDKTARQLAELHHHYEVIAFIDQAIMDKDHAELAMRQHIHMHGGKIGKNGRPTIKAVKRSASRKGYQSGVGSRDSTLHITPPPSDGSLSSPSPQHFVSTSRATPTGTHYPNSPMFATNLGHPQHLLMNMHPGYNPMSNQSSSSSGSSAVLGPMSNGIGMDSSPEYNPPESDLSGNLSNPMWYGSPPNNYQKMTPNGYGGMYEHLPIQTTQLAADMGRPMDRNTQSTLFY